MEHRLREWPPVLLLTRAGIVDVERAARDGRAIAGERCAVGVPARALHDVGDGLAVEVEGDRVHVGRELKPQWREAAVLRLGQWLTGFARAGEEPLASNQREQRRCNGQGSCGCHRSMLNALS